MSVLTLAALWDQYADQALFTRAELKGTHELPLSPDFPLSHPESPPANSWLEPDLSGHQEMNLNHLLIDHS